MNSPCLPSKGCLKNFGTAAFRRRALHFSPAQLRSDCERSVLLTCLPSCHEIASSRPLPVNELAWLRPVGVIFRRETYLPPVGRRFIEIIKAMAKDMAVPRKTHRAPLE